MIIWLDAQISPALAPWIPSTFGVETRALRDVGLRDVGLCDATDDAIFRSAKTAGATVMTKDSDFVKLQHHRGSPPQVIWLTCGNTSNRNLRNLLILTLSDALKLLSQGEALVEISAP